MRVVNRTRAAIRLITNRGAEIVLPPAGKPITVRCTTRVVGYARHGGHEVPIIERVPDPFDEPPEIGDDELIIVSAVAAKALARQYPHLAHRIAGVGDLVRHRGRVIGARSLVLSSAGDEP